MGAYHLPEHFGTHLDAPIHGGEDLAFLTGLLSLLDIALGIPMEDLLDRLGVDDEVRNVVLSHRGPLGTLLDVEDALERASLDEAALQLEAFGFDIDEFIKLEREAFQWATGGEDTLLSM